MMNDDTNSFTLSYEIWHAKNYKVVTKWKTSSNEHH